MTRKKPPDKSQDNFFDQPLQKANYRTVKTSFKSLFRTKTEPKTEAKAKADAHVQEQITGLVVRSNHIVIHTYQFIRLYCLLLCRVGSTIPDLDHTFITYCVKTLGQRDNRGKQAHNSELLQELQDFYRGTCCPPKPPCFVHVIV